MRQVPKYGQAHPYLPNHISAHGALNTIYNNGKGGTGADCGIYKINLSCTLCVFSALPLYHLPLVRGVFVGTVYAHGVCVCMWYAAAHHGQWRLPFSRPKAGRPYNFGRTYTQRPENIGNRRTALRQQHESLTSYVAPADGRLNGGLLFSLYRRRKWCSFTNKGQQAGTGRGLGCSSWSVHVAAGGKMSQAAYAVCPPGWEDGTAVLAPDVLLCNCYRFLCSQSVERRTISWHESVKGKQSVFRDMFSLRIIVSKRTRVRELAYQILAQESLHMPTYKKVL